MTTRKWLREPWGGPHENYYNDMSTLELDLVDKVEDLCDDWGESLDSIFETLKDKLRWDVFSELRQWAQHRRTSRVNAKLAVQATFLDGLMHEYAETQTDELKAVFRRIIQYEMTSGYATLYLPGQEDEIERPQDWEVTGQWMAAAHRLHPDFSFEWLLNIREDQICERCR